MRNILLLFVIIGGCHTDKMLPDTGGAASEVVPDDEIDADSDLDGGVPDDDAPDDGAPDDDAPDDDAPDDDAPDDDAPDDDVPDLDDTGQDDDLDRDDDGFPDSIDCDDLDASVNPDADEICDDIDNDCDGDVDEDLPREIWYEDADGDAHGTEDSPIEACAAPDGYVESSGDCDDADAAVNPDATEICNEIDDDCDTLIDEDVTTTFYQDLDGDGFGNDEVSSEACELPSDHSAIAGDCDDIDASIHPDADELCNEIDDDCDGVVDDDVIFLTWYLDADGDGYGTGLSTIESCDVEDGYVAVSGDCNDADVDVHPDAPERCDSIDNDCDGIVDEDGPGIWYADDDGDGFGDPDSTTTSCDPPEGFVANDDDCDDADPRVSPWAYEVCNGIDDDCDTDVDEADALDVDTWYTDGDGDGFGDESASIRACEAPTGTTSVIGDCDDSDDAISPDADEVCDGVDNDCDGSTDDADSDLVDGPTWIIDADGDGFGSEAYSMVACEAPAGWVAPGGTLDCDDLRASVNPDATEVCNGRDDDCDGEIDGAAAVDPSDWYFDADGDGFGVAGPVVAACDAPPGYADRDDDCDDGDAFVHPDAEEVCNGLDDDCDGAIDPDSLDSDEDGVANCVDETVYSEDFSSGWGAWRIIDLMGVSEHEWWGWEPPEWELVDGTLFEATNLSDSVAHSPDLGELDAFTVSIEVRVAAGMNNAAGLAFGIVDTENLFVLQWMDPIAYYGWYWPRSHIRLVSAVDGDWSVVAEASTGLDLSEPAWRWTELSVEVDGDAITARKNGVVVLTHTYDGPAILGPYSVGVWTWDNDGGVYFDNVAVTNP